MSSVQVIADITRRMGAGMAKYIQQDVETIADYDEYCHFVAGLVGVGLSQASKKHLCFILTTSCLGMACCTEAPYSHCVPLASLA